LRSSAGTDRLVWLSEHRFIEDGYLSPILPLAAAIAARTKRIRIASRVFVSLADPRHDADV
jgi:alkanesulfonate monooxygenase SsuD/methylene tetrahydromethanopterin reductase-like flavin-dependent oxidoreductase (luciferase family)